MNHWQIDRRMMLRGAGVALALPWFESLAIADSAATKQKVARLCCVMFPYGVALPKDTDPARQWGWFPTGNGKQYQLTNVLKPLDPLMDQVSIFSGLSHPRCRSMNGHDTGDTFLTANQLQAGTYRNSVSLDQVAARHFGQHTRMASLAVSTDGGIGPRTRSTTLSYNEKGQPIPALADPKLIFDRLFGQDEATKAGRARLSNSSSILDLVLQDARSLRRSLGKADQRKLDEFETSVRDVELRVNRTSQWLNTPLPKVDPESIALEADASAPREYIAAMYDLMFLAFQTDITRVATYQIGSYGPTLARTFPGCLGLEANWHSLAHKAGKKGGPEAIGKFDQFLAENLARFLTRLNETQDADGRSLLESTLVLYGSSNSRTHVNRNYPLLVAGGAQLGMRHNHYLHYDEATPMSNLFVTMLQAMGIETPSFADSTGVLSELIV